MKIWLRRAASAAFLLFAVLAGSPAWAVSTTPTAITNSAYTDLGAGPFLIQAPNNSYWYQISDTQPAANSSGFYSTGLDAVQVQSTSHVWARSINAGISLLVAPITGSASSPTPTTTTGVGYAASGKTPVTGTFTATGQSASFTPLAGRGFNISFLGTFSATVQLERSFDGTNWLPITAAGTQLYKWMAPASESDQEDQFGVLYRLNCTAFVSGTVNYQLEQ